MEQYIYTISPFITALFSVKDWLVTSFRLLSKIILCCATWHCTHTHKHTHTHRGNNIPARGLQGEVKFEKGPL